LINWHALLAAFGELTCLPVLRRSSDTQLQSLALLYYPLVGAFIAGLLVLVALVLPEKIGVTAQATLLVGLWVFLTRARHLQGLVEAFDRIGKFDKDNKSEKDSSSSQLPFNAMGVSALVLVLLVKLALLRTAFETGTIWIALPMALVTARLMALIYRLMMPVQDGAEKLAIPQYWVMGITLVVILMDMFLLGRIAGTVLAFVLALWLIYWYQTWKTLASGYTSASQGAMIEVGEVMTLLVTVIAL
jgi:adenosylcobinamide-GDP ribazoletransferase